MYLSTLWAFNFNPLYSLHLNEHLLQIQVSNYIKILIKRKWFTLNKYIEKPRCICTYHKHYVKKHIILNNNQIKKLYKI